MFTNFRPLNPSNACFVRFYSCCINKRTLVKVMAYKEITALLIRNIFS